MPRGQVTIGPSFSALRERGFTWLDKRAGEAPESALFIESNAYQREAITNAWRDDYDRLRVTVSGLSEFVLKIHERLFGPYPDIGALERRRILEQAMQAVDAETGIDNARHHTPSISELFRQLEADGVHDNSELQERLDNTSVSSDQRTVVETAFEAYLHLTGELTHPDAVTRNAKLQAVAETTQSLADAVPHLDAIVVSGLIEPSAVELQVLERLSEAFPVLVLLPTPSPDNPAAGIGAPVEETLGELTNMGFEVDRAKPREMPLVDTVTDLYSPADLPESPPDVLSWHEATTPDREVRHLARRLRERLTTEPGCDPEDILVLAPGLLSYREAIADTFEAYGVDHAYQVSVLLERTHAGRAVLDAVELCEQPHADQLGRLVTNPLVSIPDIEPTEVTDVQRRLYTSAIDPFVDTLEESAAGVEAVLERIRDVRDAPAEDTVPTFVALLEHLGIEQSIEQLDTSASIDAGYETQAFQRVKRILESVETVCLSLAPAEPLAEIGLALEGVRVPPPTRVTDGRIEILGLEDTPMAEFDELYVLGATAQHLPSRTSRPRYFQAIGEELGVFERHEQRDWDRYRFGMLLANADRVHITTPAATVNDEPLLVSPLVDELARVTGLERTTGTEDERRGSREDLQRAMAGAKPDALAPALTAAQEVGSIDSAFVKTVTRGALCGSRRATAALTEHDGQLTEQARLSLESRLQKTPFSHSRLTQYAKCGFKYMLQTGWSLEEDDDLDPEASPLVIGSLVHEALEEFYRDLQTTDGEAVNLLEYDREALEATLYQAGIDAAVETDESWTDVFASSTLRRLFAGLATPEVNEYYWPASGDDSVPTAGAFVQFLETELERAEDGQRPAYFEHEFGGTDGVELDQGRRLPISGVIDRVDTTASGDVTVFDYKTSSGSGARRRENQARDGIDFQLPMYMLGTPSLFEGEEQVPHDIAARYYVINDSPSVKLRPSLPERFDDIDFEAFLGSVVPARISEATSGIEAGAFQPATAGERTAQCEYCEFSDVCDVRHHQRYDVMEFIDTTAHPAYVPDGARPGDTLDRLPGGEADE